MRIVLHARTELAPFAALARGYQTMGHSVVWQRPGLWQPIDVDRKADAVVIHGLGGNGMKIRAAYRALGVPVWIVDLPRLRAETGAIGMFLNDLQWLPRTGTRPAIAPAALADHAGAVALVAGQKPGDFSHGMDGPRLQAWIRSAIATTRAATHLPVLFRPHPLDPSDLPADQYGADAVSHPRAESLPEVLGRSAIVVVFNSTVGWDAIAAGVPVYALADHPVSYSAYTAPGLSPTPLRLSAKARREALNRCAATQWTVPELLDGRAAQSMAAVMTRRAA